MAVLAVAVGAVLAGARTFIAIAEWAHDLPVGLRVELGLTRLAPSESTIRRTLQAVDADALDQTVSAWLAARPTSQPAAPPGPVAAPKSRPAPRAIALDGNSARGARGPDGRAVHLLAAFDHASGVVLGQAAVEGNTNEVDSITVAAAAPPRKGRTKINIEGHLENQRGLTVLTVKLDSYVCCRPSGRDRT